MSENEDSFVGCRNFWPSLFLQEKQTGTDNPAKLNDYSLSKQQSKGGLFGCQGEKKIS